MEVTVSSRGAKVEGTVTNDDSLSVAGVWALAVLAVEKRKLHLLYKSATTDQHGHFALHGLEPGKHKLFSWDGVERGAWEDEDFLEAFDDKGTTLEVVDALDSAERYGAEGQLGRVKSQKSELRIGSGN